MAWRGRWVQGGVASRRIGQDGPWRPSRGDLGKGDGGRRIGRPETRQRITSGTCEQWIKEGKGAIKWTRLSSRFFAANAVRLQLHALAYNLGNFLRTLATPEPINHWSPTTLREKLIKIGAKVVAHARYVAFQMAEVAIARNMFADILRMIAELRPPPVASTP